MSKIHLQETGTRYFINDTVLELIANTENLFSKNCCKFNDQTETVFYK